MSAFALQAGLLVLVTGGATGIGRVIAETFLSAGARVLVCDCDGDALAQELARQGELSGHRCDISHPNEVAGLFAQVSGTLGGLDVLVNNAGVSGPTAAVVALEDWERTMAVNLNAQFLCTRLAIPMLKHAGGGSIVSISSAAVRAAHALSGLEVGGDRSHQEPGDGC
jgi:NAD(P)-dependent dehydrogenase (short-subunit alcohol dehydrogenase family)